MFFWNSLAFSMIQWMLATWSLVPLLFLNPACTSRSSWFIYCWNLTGKDFEHNLTCMLNEHNCLVVGTFFHTALLWGWNENRLPVLWPLLFFPNKVTCINILVIIIEYYSLLLKKSIKAYLDKNGRGRSLGVHTNESKPTHVTMQVPWVDLLKFEGSFNNNIKMRKIILILKNVAFKECQ